MLAWSAVMAKEDSPREAALRRIAEQETRVARQQKAVAALKTHGVSTFAANQLLRTMKETLTALREALSRYPE
jgi:hypothetical protein